MDQSAYTRKIRDTTRARGPRGPQASPYRDATGSFMTSVAGGAAYVGCTNCDANAPVVPTATVPDAPTDVSGVRGAGQVTVSFVPPTNDGGSPILYYTVLTTSGLSGETIPDVSASASPIVVTSLTNGALYTFRVTATNSVGTSVPSAASDPVTPATVPGAPIMGTATAGDAEATVSFTVPPSDGGSPITTYRATSLPGGITADASASPITVTGLTNGTSYTFTVVALNDVGSSPPSATSNTVIPSIPGPAVRTVTFTTSDTWVAPVDVSNVEYLIVGGGGGSGGGFDTGGGGGGGGGMVRTGTVSVTPGSYPITVGTGGTAGISIRSPVSETNGGTGGDSSALGIVALGGEGGYASRANAGVASAGGFAAVPPDTAATGGSGGGSAGDGNGAGGGGGGSNGPGSPGTANIGGNGGAGTSSSITGSPVIYGFGGRGSNGNQTWIAVAGTPNTGNGASGGGGTSFVDENGAVGGSGIVILKYVSAYAP